MKKQTCQKVILRQAWEMIFVQGIVENKIVAIAFRILPIWSEYLCISVHFWLNLFQGPGIFFVTQIMQKHNDT